ncbi:hypothetical protein [Nocardiopsis sp. LOL_012]|uniref:hypothetical protein n=1 Tax=Nocardiopsis sp. LOL_012 TaxID=3345409 RepID=UPI003A89DE58
MPTHGFRRGHLGPREQQELLRRIGTELLSAVGDEWETVTYTAWVLAGRMADRLERTAPDGTAERMRAPLGVIDPVRELRAGMYQDGKGTWFTLTYTISRPGRFKTDYDYDGRPDFTFYPSAADFARDVELFPRDAGHTPDWLRAHLDEAARGEG